MVISIFASALVQNQTICVPEAFNIPDSEGEKAMAASSARKKMRCAERSESRDETVDFEIRQFFVMVDVEEYATFCEGDKRCQVPHLWMPQSKHAGYTTRGGLLHEEAKYSLRQAQALELQASTYRSSVG